MFLLTCTSIIIILYAVSFKLNFMESSLEGCTPEAFKLLSYIEQMLDVTVVTPVPAS